jgi:hypothetical protein
MIKKPILLSSMASATLFGSMVLEDVSTTYRSYSSSTTSGYALESTIGGSLVKEKYASKWLWLQLLNKSNKFI